MAGNNRENEKQAETWKSIQRQVDSLVKKAEEVRQAKAAEAKERKDGGDSRHI
jgi:hypothetical protein